MENNDSMSENSKRILLVEDDPLSSLCQKTELENYGYTVSHLATGAAAISAILENKLEVDLILMDINLGDGIDGTEAAETILSHIDIPIVFLSSHIEKEIVEKTEKITSYGYVVKQSGIVVLDASIKMAFKLFASKMAEKEKERALVQRERLLNLTQSLAKTGGWVLNVGEHTVEWTDELFKIHGIPKDDFNGKGLDETVEAGLACFDDKALETVQSAFFECLHNGTPYDLKLPFTARDGSKKWIRAAARAEMHEGAPKTIFGYFMDISERVKVEKENRFINAILATEHDSSLVGILAIDPEGKIILNNSKFEEMFLLTKEIISKNSDAHLLQFVMDQIEDAENFLKKIRYLYNHPHETTRDEVVLKRGLYYERSSSPIISDDNTYLGRIWFFHDITDVKTAEMNALKQLKEKEVLLQEVTHRIKNNIGSIEAMLEMELSHIQAPAARRIFQDAIGRMESMKLIYEKLLASRNYQSMSVRLYLKELLDAVLGIFSDDKNLSVTAHFDDFEMNIKDLFVLGLILNELVTNSMKYAFTDDDSGTLKISLETDGKTAEFVVHDSGKGIPEKKEIHNGKRFGLFLVSILSEQLSGTFSQIVDNGFISKIAFPYPDKA